MVAKACAACGKITQERSGELTTPISMYDLCQCSADNTSEAGARGQLPVLPEDPGHLFERDTLLDKVFSQPDSPAMPRAVVDRGEDGENDEWHRLSGAFKGSPGQPSQTSSLATRAQEARSDALAVDEQDEWLQSEQPLKRSFSGPMASIKFFLGRCLRLLVPLLLLCLCLRLGMLILEKVKPGNNQKPDAPAPEMKNVNAARKQTRIRTIKVQRRFEAPAKEATNPTSEPSHRHAYQTILSAPSAR